jgi:6-phosphogluconolactonase
MKLLTIIALLSSIPTLFAASVDVYFGTSGKATKGIYHSSFDTDSGKLSPPELAAEIGSPGFLALHPSKSYLYAVATSDQGPCVAAYKIGKNGRLTLLNTEVIGDGGGAHISVHPSGKFLLTAQYGGGSVALFPVAKDGKVQPRGQLIEHEGGSGIVASRQNAPHPHWTGYSPDGEFAFVPDLGLDKIVIYKVNANRPSITAHGIAGSVPGGGPRHMRFSVDGNFIYLLNELSLSVTTFQYDAKKGTTKRLTTTPALSESDKSEEVFNSSSEILVHPNGKFVYSANRGDDTVTAYQANRNTGELTVTEVEPVRGAFPRNINLEPSGKWLLAAGQHSNTIAVFAIDQSTGEITYQLNSVVNVPGPICILFNE